VTARTQAAAPTRAAAPAPALTFDERLALSPLAMDDRLDRAGLRFDVNTAGIELPEAPEILTAPMPAAETPMPATVPEVFAEAARLITVHGRICGYVGSAETGYCLIGAIRAAAGGNRKLEDAAETDMLDRIRRQFPDALSVGSWHDAQAGPAPVLRMLGT
jgi:hypothetical protein